MKNFKSFFHTLFKTITEWNRRLHLSSLVLGVFCASLVLMILPYFTPLTFLYPHWPWSLKWTSFHTNLLNGSTFSAQHHIEQHLDYLKERTSFYPNLPKLTVNIQYAPSNESLSFTVFKPQRCLFIFEMDPQARFSLYKAFQPLSRQYPAPPLHHTLFPAAQTSSSALKQDDPANDLSLAFTASHELAHCLFLSQPFDLQMTLVQSFLHDRIPNLTAQDQQTFVQLLHREDFYTLLQESFADLKALQVLGSQLTPSYYTYTARTIQAYRWSESNKHPNSLSALTHNTSLSLADYQQTPPPSSANFSILYQKALLGTSCTLLPKISNQTPFSTFTHHPSIQTFLQQCPVIQDALPPAPPSKT